MPPKKTTRNIEMLMIVAKGLKGLKQKVVFVGGATVDLFIGDPASPKTRATDDVDCVVEIARRGEYYALEEELRGLGFQHPLETDTPTPLCRWKFSDIKVDVMPTEGAVLGFTNQWYPDGMANAEEVLLPNGERVFTFSVPYLLASKLEAFRDRGKGDFLASRDMEDIIALLDGCPELEQKVGAAPENARRYLAQEFARLLSKRLFLLALDGQLQHAAQGRDRIAQCLDLMRRVAGRADFPK